ncbi:MAG TPA: TetR/AcrR family transcriptional regulator [Burkholderiaceae bacterium]|nr:TetR/AcrR family transcriptional regulator [Burkholderiaceae bacterium]
MSAVSSHSPRWTRRKEARPGELLEAALELFVERGFASTRLDEVAARAGVSKGTLYLYFASKEDLFKAVVRQNIVPLIEAFERDVAASQAASPDLLREFFDAWWTRFGGTKLAGIAKLVVGEAGNFPELAQFFQQEVVSRNLQLLRSIIERGIAREEFAPVDLDACVNLWISPLVMRAIWEHSIGPCCPSGTVVPVERFLEAHLRSILSMLAVRAAATRAHHPTACPWQPPAGGLG